MRIITYFRGRVKKGVALGFRVWLCVGVTDKTEKPNDPPQLHHRHPRIPRNRGRMCRTVLGGLMRYIVTKGGHIVDAKTGSRMATVPMDDLTFLEAAHICEVIIEALEREFGE